MFKREWAQVFIGISKTKFGDMKAAPEFNMSIWKNVSYLSFHEVNATFCESLLTAGWKSLGIPVYHVEKPRPFISPSYLIWSCHGIFYVNFSKSCKFPLPQKGGLMYEGGGG